MQDYIENKERQMLSYSHMVELQRYPIQNQDMKLDIESWMSKFLKAALIIKI